MSCFRRSVNDRFWRIAEAEGIDPAAEADTSAMSRFLQWVISAGKVAIGRSSDLAIVPGGWWPPLPSKYMDLLMTQFRAATGVVDRLQGLPLPNDITLYAIAVSSKPNLDGIVDPDAVVSHCPVPIEFSLERNELRSKTRVSIPLIEGAWCHLYIQLHDAAGVPYGKGVASMGGLAAHWIEAAPDMITVKAPMTRH